MGGRFSAAEAANNKGKAIYNETGYYIYLVIMPFVSVCILLPEYTS